jgi:hypothetical protein
MRRPRASLVSLHSGGPGQPSAGTTTGRLQWRHVARTKGGESRPDGDPNRSPVGAGKRGPGDRKAAMERREAGASRQTRARRKAGNCWCASWRSIPLTFGGGEKGSGAARRSNNRAGGALRGANRVKPAHAGCLTLSASAIFTPSFRGARSANPESITPVFPYLHGRGVWIPALARFTRSAGMTEKQAIPCPY